MKRTFGLALLGLLVFAGCDRTPYLAEKEFWKAEQILKQVQAEDVKADPKQVLSPVIEAYESVVDRFPSTTKAVDALFIISKLHIQLGDYDAAIADLQRVIQNYSHDKNTAAQTRYRIAEIYESLGQWDKAEPMYWEIADYHPLHPKGLFAPVHIIVHYKKAKDPVGQEKAYAKAIDFYRRTLKQLGPIQGASTVKNNEAMAHLAQGNWREAEQAWISVTKDFPESSLTPMALLAAAELSWSKQNYANSEDYYNRYFKNYPDHMLRGRTAAKLGALYLEKKDYENAQTWLVRSLDEHGKNREGIAETKLLLGQTAESQDKNDEAVQIYQDVWNNYTDTVIYLQAPVYLAGVYEKMGQNDQKDATLRSAVEHYLNIEKTSTNRRLILLAQQVKTSVLAELGEWQQIIDNFQVYIDKESSEEKKGKFLFAQALLSERNLKDEQKAAALYEQLIQTYPNHPLAESAKTRRDLLLKSTTQV